MIAINKSREILGEVAKGMSDREIENLRDIFIILSDLAIDSYLAKRRFISDEQKYEKITG